MYAAQLVSLSAAHLTQGNSVHMRQLFRTLAKITSEPPALPPVEHAGAHISNAPALERQFAKSYLGPHDSRESISLRKAIAKGARESLEEQYWDVIERTIQSRPVEARLGGDPSVGNKIRAYLLMRYYHNGEWADRIEVGIEKNNYRCATVTDLLS